MWLNGEKRDQSNGRSEWGDYVRRSLRFPLSHERGVKIEIHLGVSFLIVLKAPRIVRIEHCE